MSIKPIDMQVIIPNTAKLSHERQGEQDKNVSINQNITQQIKDKYEHEVEYVHEKDNAEKIRIQKKQQEEDSTQHHTNDEEQDNEDEEDKKEKDSKKDEQVVGSKFDIKV